MDVLRELCEELTSQRSQQEVRRLLRDYEQKIERLRRAASEIHTTLQPPVGGPSKNKSVPHKNGRVPGKRERKPFAKWKNIEYYYVFSFGLHVPPSVSIYNFDSFLGRPWTRLRTEEGMPTVRRRLRTQIISHQLKRCYTQIMYFPSKLNEKGQVDNNPLLIN